MTEIPAEIMEAARKAIGDTGIDHGTTYQFERHVEAIARAIMAHTASLEEERDRYRRGLEMLACTFFKEDQHQDYAKHILHPRPSPPREG